MKNNRKAVVLVSVLFLSLQVFAGDSARHVFKVPDKVKDVFQPAGFNMQNAVMEGYLGERMRINIEKRLLTLNLPSILEPYLHRPGKQTWIGEHVGKFLHAAILSWEYTGDERLKQKADSVARVLISTQQPDGYLGTYLEPDRWTEWDVWTHKYNLIGLLTYYNSTGYQPALESCKKVGTLLINTFQKGNRDIIKAGWHTGMAATSILEPMVMLYRYTGDKQYLGFCQYIVQSWDEPNGPKILSSLLQTGSVYKTANAKAYEMLSNIVGLSDLYRMTGEASYLTACTNAWNDVITRRHYLTGTTSWAEFFQDDNVLRPDGEVLGDTYKAAGEGCVTVTWEQLNLQLLRLTGASKYADELERIMYNALTGAQSPTNGSVCYFVPLTGRKRFGEVSHGILPDVSCCASSVPRGIAMIPQSVIGTLDGSRVVLWQYTSGHYALTLRQGKKEVPVELSVQTSYPENGAATITFNLPKGQKLRFPMQLRNPKWCSGFRATLNGQEFLGKQEDLLTIDREWQNGDQLQISIPMELQVHADNNKGSGEVIMQRGPQVLALDDMLDTHNSLPKAWVGDQFYEVKGLRNGKETIYRMVPFADAGQTMGHYQVPVDSIENPQLIALIPEAKK